MSDAQPTDDTPTALDLLRSAVACEDPRATVEALMAPEHAAALAALDDAAALEVASLLLRLEGVRGLRAAVIRLRKAIGLARPRPAASPDDDSEDDATPLHARVTEARVRLAGMMRETAAHDPLAALYAVDGRVSRLRKSGERVTIADAGSATLAVALSAAMPWTDRVQGVPGPPTVITAAIHEAPEGALPILDRVTHGPCLDAAGVLVATRGYSPSLRAYLDVPADLTVVDTGPPGAIELADARNLLSKWVRDFPFETDSDRANFMALNISVLCRELYSGPCPMFMVSAPSRGAGKTLLATLAQDVHQGSRVVRTWPRTEEEDRTILAMLRPRHPIVLFDNVDDALDSPSLAALTTAETWSGRLLGLSAEITVPVRSVLVLTGRSPATTDELARRTRVIHLVPQAAKPWLRSEWGIDDITGWTRAKRGDLLSALLVLVRHWQAAKCPPPKTTLGSYEDWARVVGGIVSLTWPGWDEEPPERAELRVQDLATTVISWWANRCSHDALFATTLTTTALIQMIRDEEATALVEGVKVVSLGRMLTSRHGCTVDVNGKPWRFSAKAKQNGSQVWHVEPAEPDF